MKLVGLKDGRLAASFDDFTIKITNSLNFTNYSILQTSDGNLHVWNAITFEFVQTVGQNNRPILALATSNSNLAYGSADTNIYVNGNRYLLNFSILFQADLTAFIFLPKSNNLVTADAGVTINVWKFTNMNTNPSIVNRLKFKRNFD